MDEKFQISYPKSRLIVLNEEIIKKQKIPNNHYQELEKPYLLAVSYHGEQVEINEIDYELSEQKESTTRSFDITLHLVKVMRALLLLDFDQSLNLPRYFKSKSPENE